MRKLILFNMITLDGFFEGPGAMEIDWHHIGDAEEFNSFAVAQIKEADALVFGRATYVMMASYWPTQQARESDPVVANLMNTFPKFVFSRTLKGAVWNNSNVVSDAEEIRRLKALPGKDMLLFGSAKLASAFAKMDVIDEYRLMINPLVLGAGKSMFRDLKSRMKLNLIDSRTFKSGNVLLTYGPLKQPEKSQL